jgi:hypothetical protein
LTVAESLLLSTDAGNTLANLPIAPDAILDLTVKAGAASLTPPADTPAQLDARVNVWSMTIMTITGWPISVSRLSAQEQRQAKTFARPRQAQCM